MSNYFMKNYNNNNTGIYTIAILDITFNYEKIKKNIIDPHLSNYIDECTFLYLKKDPSSKIIKAAKKKECIAELIPKLQELRVKYLLVCNGEYFKTLTGLSKVDKGLYQILDCIFADFKVMYCPTVNSIFYDPINTTKKIGIVTSKLADHIQNKSNNTLKIQYIYPETPEEIQYHLDSLIQNNKPISCDIETYSLNHYNAGIGTIAFCTSDNKGISFAVDFNNNINSEIIREKLKDFFINFNNNIKYHNITFDVYILIYQLFMKDLLDTKGLLLGLEIMLKDIDCTQIISFLCTNSCARVPLSLKYQASEFLGDYALEDINDINKANLNDLLEYNILDTVATWHVYNKYYNTLIKDKQLDIYNTIFKDAVKDIIQMQLTGLPINKKKVQKLKQNLQDYLKTPIAIINSSIYTQKFLNNLINDWVITKNNKLKNKIVTNIDCPDTVKQFNCNSSVQLQKILYDSEYMGLEILDYTKSNKPATDKTALKNLIKVVFNEDKLEFIEAVLKFKQASTILQTFIPAFEKAISNSDNDTISYLYGKFKLGGTVSGRLSSHDPNLQNLPATDSIFSKNIKKCFEPPKGWLLVSIDADSLEDKISALTTKDPNKLKVYIDGYDGHSLRAYTYFSDQMNDINPDSVTSINSISDKYPELRQASKAPTFALTYQGTEFTLVKNCGFTKDLAKHIKTQYDDLYKISTNWIKLKLIEATNVGYITAAFGLRVRTPILEQTILNNKYIPSTAKKEARTAGNALGQSWCLLNTRAASAFLKKVRIGKYKHDIKPCVQIHDSQLYLIKDDIDILLYVNDLLTHEMSWQEHPDIYHPVVKLSGTLVLHHPTWADKITIPNNITKQSLKKLLNK